MDTRDPLGMVHRALVEHDMPATRLEGEVRVEGHDLRFGAATFDLGEFGAVQRVVFEVRVSSPRLGGQPIVETFAGFADTREQAVLLAFEKFLRGVFHVVVEALADHVCGRMQADVEHWRHGDAAWKVFVGPMVTHGSQERLAVDAYRRFFPRLEDLFRTSASPGSHFVRCFAAGLDGKLTGAEVLLNNETWPQGEGLFREHDWNWGEGFQSVRQVFLALPETQRC